jgi:hypothetical protein
MVMTSTRVLVVSLGLLAVSSTASATDVTGPMTFVGIIPCRIVETRTGFGYSGINGPPSLVANEKRIFQITGFVPGLPAQCEIPETAAAISVNFTVTNFAGAGDLRVFPAVTPVPNSSILNYELENVANATTVALWACCGGESGITVQADGSGTDFIADVNGYYVPRPFTLERGQTMIGQFAASGVATFAGQVFTVALSFPFPLARGAEAPDANYIPIGGAPTNNCPGSIVNPAAARGQLCLYERDANATFTGCIFGNGSRKCFSTDPDGAIVFFNAPGPGTMLILGKWAVTAP